MKEELSKSTTPTLYDPLAEMKLSADASIWFRGGPPAEGWLRLEASRICLKVDDRNLTLVCSGRKRGLGHHLGLWEVLHVHPGEAISSGNRSQTTCPPTRLKTPGQSSTLITSFSPTSCTIRLFHCPHPRKTHVHSRYLVPSPIFSQWRSHTGGTSQASHDNMCRTPTCWPRATSTVSGGTKYRPSLCTGDKILPYELTRKDPS